MNFIEAANAAFGGEKIYYHDCDGERTFLVYRDSHPCSCYLTFELFGDDLIHYPLDIYSVNTDNWQIEAEKPKMIMEKHVDFTEACKAALDHKIVYRTINYNSKVYLHHLNRAPDRDEKIILPHFTTLMDDNKKTYLGINFSDITSTWTISEK